MSADVCPRCEGETPYTCGCCPDCGAQCMLAADQCATRCEDEGPIDYDDDSREDDFDPYEP